MERSLVDSMLENMGYQLNISMLRNEAELQVGSLYPKPEEICEI